ncbi:MAG: TetR/AcrR family transcriptional regulator [Rhodobacteraceae bacterium]|nr:TetR/AcrR family transcriptional regulator [Paracoccaceae bacterium]
MNDEASTTDILIDVPGVRAASQRRSRQKRDAMLQAGLELMRDAEFEHISIQQITAKAGCSVGSFYERFEDKDSFLLALQIQVFHRQLQDARETLAPEKWADTDIEEVLAAAVRFIIDSFRGEAEGLLKAAMVRSIAKPEVWGPSRAASEKLSDVLKCLLLPRLAGTDAEQRIDVAVQTLNGVLLNMILRDPGPLKLCDGNTDEVLAKITRSVLQPFKS